MPAAYSPQVKEEVLWELVEGHRLIDDYKQGGIMGFGPNLLLDKSTLQGLSFECWQYAGRYYQHLISPILLRELTSGIAKEKINKPETELKLIVGHLAAKTRTPQSQVLPDFLKMVCNELLGHVVIPMNGQQIPLEHGVSVDVPGLGRGLFFDEHPMMQTLRNWADGKFSQEDMQKATSIREDDSSVDLVSLYLKIEQETDEEARVPVFKTLREVVDYADKIRFFRKTPRQEVLRVARYFFQDHSGHVGAVMRCWRRKGRPSLRDFAPYALYVHRVGIVHHYCLLCGFIRRSKKGKAHLDVQYLYYLPFCRVFSSDDNDLLKLVPFFLRKDQILVSKTDFQNDLRSLAKYFSEISEEEANAFHLEYGTYPPDLENSFTVTVWEKFMRPRRPLEGEASRPSPEDSERILNEMRAFEEAYQNQIKRNV